MHLCRKKSINSPQQNNINLSFSYNLIVKWFLLFHSRCNSWRKRGLGIIPNKYCLALAPICRNQGGALLHVYTDGSVLLTHGGIEVGQGLHTKMIQVSPLKWLLFPSLYIVCAHGIVDKEPHLGVRLICGHNIRNNRAKHSLGINWE